MNSAPLKIVLVECCSISADKEPTTLEFTTIGSQATWMWTAAEGTVVKYLPNGGDQSLAGCYEFLIQPDGLPGVPNMVPEDSEITVLNVPCESAAEVDSYCNCSQEESSCYMIDACNDEELPFQISLRVLQEPLAVGYIYSFLDPSGYLQTAGCFKVLEIVDCSDETVFTEVEVTAEYNSTDCDICVPCYELTDCSDPSNTLNIQWEPDAEPLDPNISYTFTFAPGVCWSAKLGTSPCEATRYDSRNITGGASSCEECLRRCYKLIDCEGLYPTISTESILFETYVGKTILWQDQLAVEHCATVELYNCEQEIIPTEPIIVLDCYDTCPECLYVPIPVPTIKPGTRSVRPGYNSPACSPEYYKNVSCNFSEYVYQNMIAKRYGLDSCCEINQEKYEIKKALLDLAVVTDPNLCNPECTGYTYDFFLPGGEGAFLTYTNCEGVEETIIYSSSRVGAQFSIAVCALNNEPPVLTIQDNDGNTINQHILEVTNQGCCCEVSMTVGEQIPDGHGTYTQELIITYSFVNVISGIMTVNGQDFGFDITSSPQTIVLENLISDGLPVDVSISFPDNATCDTVIIDAFIAASTCVNRLWEVFFPVVAFPPIRSFTANVCNGGSEGSVVGVAGGSFTVCSAEEPVSGDAPIITEIGICSTIKEYEIIGSCCSFDQVLVQWINELGYPQAYTMFKPKFPEVFKICAQEGSVQFTIIDDINPVVGPFNPHPNNVPCTTPPCAISLNPILNLLGDC